MRNRLRIWLNDVPLQNPLQRRQAPLVQVILLFLIGASLLAEPVLMISVTGSGAILSVMTNALLLVLTLAALVVLRRGHFNLAVALAAFAFLPGLSISLLSSGLRASSLLFLLFSLPIVLVGLLAGRRALVAMIAVSIGIVTLVGMLEQYAPTLVDFAPSTSSLNALITIFALMVVVLGLFLDRFGSSLRGALTESLAREQELEKLRTSLEATVAARTAELQARADEQAHLLADQAELLSALEQERATVRELSVPVIPISDTTLIMPLIGAMDTSRLLQLQKQALGALERSAAQTIIFDITGVPVVDSQVAQGLLQVVAAARLLGARVMLVGIRPEVAQALVGLGIHMGDIRTFSDLQSALRALGNQRPVMG